MARSVSYVLASGYGAKCCKIFMDVCAIVEGRNLYLIFNHKLFFFIVADIP